MSHFVVDDFIPNHLTPTQLVRRTRTRRMRSDRSVSFCVFRHRLVEEHGGRKGFLRNVLWVVNVHSAGGRTRGPRGRLASPGRELGNWPTKVIIHPNWVEHQSNKRLRFFSSTKTFVKGCHKYQSLAWSWTSWCLARLATLKPPSCLKNAFRWLLVAFLIRLELEWHEYKLCFKPSLSICQWL